MCVRILGMGDENRMGWLTDEMGDLNGKVAIVTGASTGIGMEIVRRLAEHNVTTVMACRTSEGRSGEERDLG